MRFVALVLCAWISWCARPLTAGEAVRGMVASGHPLATEAGLRVLRQGGNAVDAAVAVGLTLGVVDGKNSGIGGGCLILVRSANGTFAAIDGRETAPARATPERFLVNGKAQTELSQTGALASGVPGALAAYDYAVRHFGTRKLAELILPAATLAEEGFPLSAGYAKAIKSVAAELARFPEAAHVFLPDGRPPVAGELLRQPDLAKSYRQIARQGTRWFYRGEFARSTEKWMRANGGVMTARDFRSYTLRLREPILTRYRGCEIVGFPPPSSGGVAVAETLGILEHFDLKGLEEPARLHVVAEAMKLAFADRAHWLGDSDFASVPRGLFSAGYCAALATNISLDGVTPVKGPGRPPAWNSDVFRRHTTHFSVADDAGNWVACTATVNTTLGSKVVIPGTGIVLNNQMDDFSLQPGVTNYFGLVGSAANAVAPGKRPLSSMSPTIVLTNGAPFLALGGAGGPTIISQVVQELVAMLDLGMSPEAALAAPRIHHQWFPDELQVEKLLEPATRAALASRGHHLSEAGLIGVSQIVARDGRGIFRGAADPRGEGLAAGW